MSFATVTRSASERRGFARSDGGARGLAGSAPGNPARRPEGVSAPQILRLAILMLLAAFCIWLSTVPRTGHAEEQSALHALAAKAPRMLR
jgi:hypothetical protein